jgi:hypothetical protein
MGNHKKIVIPFSYKRGGRVGRGKPAEMGLIYRFMNNSSRTLAGPLRRYR